MDNYREVEIEPNFPRLPELSQKQIHHFVVLTKSILPHFRSVLTIAMSIPEKPFVGHLQKKRPEGPRRQQRSHQNYQNDVQRDSVSLVERE
jgi:hypothetical protein